MRISRSELFELGPEDDSVLFCPSCRQVLLSGKQIDRSFQGISMKAAVGHLSFYRDGHEPPVLLSSESFGKTKFLLLNPLSSHGSLRWAERGLVTAVNVWASFPRPRT